MSRSVIRLDCPPPQNKDGNLYTVSQSAADSQLLGKDVI